MIGLLVCSTELLHADRASRCIIAGVWNALPSGQILYLSAFSNASSNRVFRFPGERTSPRMITDRESRSGVHGQDAPLRVTTYSPESAILHPWDMARGMIEDLKASRGLAWRLARRDISAQYRQSFLGYLWAFILPVSNTLAWVFLNSSGIIKVANTGLPYPVYVLTGTMLWQMFIEALQSPLQQVTNSKTMLAKLNFPRESLIVSGIIKWWSNAGVKLLILIPVMMLFGVYPDWHLALVPVAMIAILIVGTGIGLMLAPIGMLYNDIGKAIPIFAQFAMFVTPVVFAMPTEGLTARLFQLNFMTPLILQGRSWLTGYPGPLPEQFILVTVVFSIIMILGWALFRVTMPILIERMST